MHFSLKRMSAGLALAGASVLVPSMFAQADTLLDENFQSGLQGFDQVGRISTGTYGVRLRGGSAGSITSQAINTSGYSNLSLEVARTATGLDEGESASILVSKNGGPFNSVESVRRASGSMSFPLGSDADSVAVKLTLDADRYFERLEVSSLVLTGDKGADTCSGAECDDDQDDMEDDQDTPQTPTGLNDPGTGSWEVAQDVRNECNLDPDLLQAADREFGNDYLIVRYGKICHEYYGRGRDTVTDVWSTTKTLGAVTVGAAMYESRNFTEQGRKTGPLTEFQRVDHWLDRFSYHDDATIAHVLSMEGHNRSLDYGDKSHSYDTVGSVQINSLSDVVNEVVSQDSARLGRNIGEFYEKFVADRLGFEDSQWGNSDRSKTFAYSWSTTAKDMARLGLMMLNGGMWNGERMLDAQYVYNLGHAVFEDGSSKYGYLTWLSEDDDCGPAPIHKSYPHGISEARDCERRGRGCEQTEDVGVFFAAGLGGQYIIQHRGLDMVIVVKDSGVQSSKEVIRVWDAIRPAVVAMDSTYPGNESAFCEAYGSNSYAPDLKLWEGGL